MRATLTMAEAEAALTALVQLSKVPLSDLSAATRIAIARNIIELRPAVEAHQTGLQARQQDLADDNGRLDFLAARTFQAEFDTARARSERFRLVPVPVDDLKLDQNPVPPNAIADLATAQILVLRLDDDDAETLKEAAE